MGDIQRYLLSCGVARKDTYLLIQTIKAQLEAIFNHEGDEVEAYQEAIELLDTYGIDATWMPSILAW